jgi:hypothetical protein
MSTQTNDLHTIILNNIQLINNKIIKSIENHCHPSIKIDHTLNSRIIAYEQIHLRRVLELLKGISVCAENQLTVPTMLASRAFIETVAVFTGFHNELKTAIESKNFLEAYNVISKYIKMSRDKDLKNELLKEGNDIINATSTQTQIIKLKVHNPSVEKSYDRFSEICHPNYGGLAGLYTTLDDQAGVIYFTNTEKHLNAILDAMIEIKNSGKPFYNLLNSIYQLMRNNEEELNKYYNIFINNDI